MVRVEATCSFRHIAADLAQIAMTLPHFFVNHFSVNVTVDMLPLTGPKPIVNHFCVNVTAGMLPLTG